MNEIESILNSPAIQGCLIIKKAVKCPYDDDTRIHCYDCIWYERSSNNAKIKKLIPILLID